MNRKLASSYAGPLSSGRRALSALVGVFGILALPHCAAPTGDASSDDVDREDDGTPIQSSDDELKATAGRTPYIYRGLMPALENPSIVVSLSAHTARVSGTLPDSFSPDRLPSYADMKADGSRRVAVVYPIATGAPGHSTPPGSFEVINIDKSKASNGIPWGGFPFIYYNPVGAGIAFHGPITDSNSGTDMSDGVGTWKLLRGKVSHGCNRMLGEHVVELAHILGANMRKNDGGTVAPRGIDVKVVSGFDTWRGKNVDVDFPRATGASPVPAAHVFKTWRSEFHHRWVCEYTPAVQRAGHCPD